MNSKPSTLIALENKLVHQSYIFLALATLYGIAAGAFVTMYYDVVPNMPSLEDRIGSILGMFYLLAVGTTPIHLPLAFWYAIRKMWADVWMRVIVILGPFIVVLGTDGLISHSLWWAPLSDTDRFHIFHHTLVAGVPLTILYWLALRAWHPSQMYEMPNLKKPIIASCGIILFIILGMGILFGSFSIAFLFLAAMFALLAITLFFVQRQENQSII